MILKAICILFLGLWSPVLSQITIKGIVTDQVNNKPLPAANIQVEETVEGTISNADGRFMLKADQIPLTILITYIGYESKRITIEEPTCLMAPGNKNNAQFA